MLSQPFLSILLPILPEMLVRKRRGGSKGTDLTDGSCHKNFKAFVTGALPWDSTRSALTVEVDRVAMHSPEGTEGM